jgi:replicative DNA helicase
MLTSNFQELLLSCLISDKGFYVKWNAQIKEDNFSEDHKIIYSIIKKHIDSFSAVPTIRTLKDEVNKTYSGDKFHNLRQVIKNILKRVKKNSAEDNRKYVEEGLSQYIKISSIKSILPDIMMKIDEDPDEAIRMIEKTLSSFKDKLSERTINFFSKGEIEKRKASLYKQREEADTISTLICALDRVLKDQGVARKKLCVLSGPYNIGKTTLLVFIAKAAILQNRKVVFITMEETKEEIANRFDASFTGISINDLSDVPDKFYNKMIRMSEEYHDSLRILEAPISSMTVKDIDMYLESLKIEFGFEPDLVAIDNLDSLKPSFSKHRNELGDSTNIWRDSRAMAQRRNLIIWTPSQINRGEQREVQGGDKEVAMGSGISSNIEKMNLSDLHITINPAHTEEEEVNELSDVQDVVIFIDKNRMGRRYLMFDLELDVTANSIRYNSNPIYRKLQIGRKKTVNKEKK